MLPVFLLPETTVREAGNGSELNLGESQGRTVLLTLGITRIIEQESLEVSVSGSADRQRWRPLATFPQKFYCGSYSMVLDLSRHPEVRYLRAEWSMNRWGEARPLFGFYLLAAEPKLQHAAVG